jgi:F-type H+-transporting ATPase subunit delta
MSVAKSYAKALFETLSEQKTPAVAVDLLETELDGFIATIDKANDAKIALYSPLTTAREKVAFVQKLSEAMKLSGLLPNFLQLLARKNRLVALKEVREAFHQVRLSAEGGVAGQVVSAEPMDQKDIESLAQSFSKKLGKRVVFKVSTDASLLAGMKVTVSGVTYDGTLRSQLQKLRDQVALGAEGNA